MKNSWDNFTLFYQQVKRMEGFFKDNKDNSRKILYSMRYYKII